MVSFRIERSRAFSFGLFILFNLLRVSQSGIRLSKSIGYYEILSYSSDDVHTQHNRVKRSAEPANELLEINFASHGKDFRLRLRRDTTTFTDDFHRDNEDGDVPIDTTHIYSGYLRDIPGSAVYGSVWDGIFEGNIETPDEGTYFVERATKYWDKDSKIFFLDALDNPSHHSGVHTERLVSSDGDKTNGHQPMGGKFHSVIYHEKQVSDVPLGKSDGKKFGTCGLSSDSVESWMHHVEDSMEAQDVEERVSEGRRKRSPQWSEAGNSIHRQYSNNFYANSQSVNQNNNGRRSSLLSQRSGVNPGGGVGSANGNGTCEMFIRTDPLLYKFFLENEGISENRVQEEIASLVQQLIRAVSNIYSNTKFNMGRYNHSGITFAVQRLRVDNYTKDCELERGRTPSGKPRNIFCNPSIDVTNFLTFFSHENHDAFCLAFMLTYRDFSDGTLGLAWVASPSRGNKGGVCERRGRISGQDQELSLNTGVVTFLNYNSKVTPKVSQLTLAHEIGHNFGAAHDPDVMPQCIPGPENGGNYIMYRHATKGNSPNNRRFSPCSIRNISLVLDAIYQSTQADNGKYYCFKASNLTFCGNRMVEEGEECDCGFDDHECRDDKCCYPRINSDGKQHKFACRLVHGRDSCSPSQGPCCRGSECSVIKRQEGMGCAKVSECKERSFCDGKSPSCPPPPFKPELTECNQNTQVCVHGDCTGAYCLKWGLQECFLTSSKIDDRKKLCELACQLDGRPETCTSSSALVAALLGLGHVLDEEETNEIVGSGLTPELIEQFAQKAKIYNTTTPLRTIHLMPGSACDNYQGYCDVFQKCRQVDEEGPLLRIKRLFFGKETLKSIQGWITERWWATVLMGVGFIVTMAGFIKCCAVHTPSSNPKRPPARRLQDTFYYVPMTTARRVGSAASSTLRRMRHHHHHQGHGHPSGGGGGGRRLPGYASTAAAAGINQHELRVAIPPMRNGGPILAADAEAIISLAPPPPRHGGRGAGGGRGSSQPPLPAVPLMAIQAVLPKPGKRGSRPSTRDFNPVVQPGPSNLGRPGPAGGGGNGRGRKS